MSDFTPSQCLLFGDLAKRPVTAVFDQTQGSSDGGAILLEASNRRYGNGLIEGLTACFQDRRQAGKVERTIDEILKQRIYGLACGYEDANDAARLSKDPIHKMLLDSDPVAGLDLASQSTMSRTSIFARQCCGRATSAPRWAPWARCVG